MKFIFALGLATAVCSSAAYAADKPVIGPPAAWVSPATTPKPAAALGSEAVSLLLYDTQIHLGPEGQSTYQDSVMRVQTPQGLSGIGTIAVSWNPDLDQMVIHKLRLVRDGQVIDILAKQSFTVLRRETNLEMAALDGRLTAAIQPEDLRVGDLVELSYTVTHKDPALAGRFEDIVAIPNGQIDDVHVSIDSDAKTPFRWRRSDNVGATTLKVGEGSKMSFEIKDMTPVRSPEHAPIRYAAFPHVELTTFTSWADVSAVMAPLYAKAEALAAASPLNAEVARIKALSSDPKVRTEAALALVQNQIRYLALSMNDGGYVPATADETWSRRFGDCKGKTVLLLTLLHALGIEAQPAIVNSNGSDGLDMRLPEVENFDHVIVRATLNGRVYWLDGTRQGDRHLDDIETPPFIWALPVQAGGANLVRLVQSPLDKPNSVSSLELDASAGLDAPAPAHAEQVITGDAAVLINNQFANLSASDRDTGLKTFWNERYDFIKPKTVSARFDPETRVETISLDGTANLTWDTIANSPARHLQTNGAALGWKPDFVRLYGSGENVPFAVIFPTYEETRETITLPQGGKGFSVEGEDVDRKIAGYAFRRVSKIEKDLFTLVSSTRSLAPEFPASEADVAAKALKDLSVSDVYVRAPSNYRSSAAELSSLKGKTLSTSEDYVTRGLSLMHAGAFGDAADDFRKAAAIDPKSAAALADLALAETDLKDFSEAKSDLDKAAVIDPAYWGLFEARGHLASVQNDWDAAVTAFSRAVELNADDSYAREQRSLIYAKQRKFDLAMTDAEELARRSPNDDNPFRLQAQLLILQGKKAEAVAIADQVLAKAPDRADLHVFRANILGSVGRWDEARTEIDRAIALQPTAQAYGMRASLRRNASDLKGASADLDAAQKLEPDLPLIYEIRAAMAVSAEQDDAATDAYSKLVELGQDTPNVRLSRGEAYARLNKVDLAAIDFAVVRPAIRTNADLLNDLCWDQAKAGMTLELALKDCDAAIALKPQEAAYRDSRGLVLLRLGRYAEAVASYDAALKTEKGSSTSLFGRGLAKIKGGLPGGQADLADARKVSPKIDQTFAKMGLKP